MATHQWPVTRKEAANVSLSCIRLCSSFDDLRICPRVPPLQLSLCVHSEERAGGKEGPRVDSCRPYGSLPGNKDCFVQRRSAAEKDPRIPAGKRDLIRCHIQG